MRREEPIEIGMRHLDDMGENGIYIFLVKGKAYQWKISHLHFHWVSHSLHQVDPLLVLECSYLSIFIGCGGTYL